MQLAVEPDFMHHLTTKRLQATIVVVQMDAGNMTHQPVEDSRRQHLMPRVVPLALPAAYHVESLVDFGEQASNFGRIILQVTIDGDNSIAFGRFESGAQCGCLAEIAAET